MELTTDTFNRLSLGLIEKQRCTPEMAMNILLSLKLNLLCGDDIANSQPLQAALITAVNTGKRAFLGGIYVCMPEHTSLAISWPNAKYLNDVVTALGGKIVDMVDPGNFTLTFGLKASSDKNELQVVCNSWQGGVMVDEESTLKSSGVLPMGGIFAAGFAVSLAFLKMSGINIAVCDNSKGVSLWRPDLHWLHNEASGPESKLLPKKYWLLGLGHLGQAFLWNISMLPYSDKSQVKFLLQDYDKLVAANWSAGLLSNLPDANFNKTRVCAAWLEERGFETAITERAFDENTKRSKEEPYLALCGFDTAASRIPLENAGFDHIVEAGLGANLGTFDVISLHTFPNGYKSPEELWGDSDEANNEINEVIHETLKHFDHEKCGIIPLEIAGKALSASFVGACAGAMVIAECLRGLAGGKRYDKLTIQLRNIEKTASFVNVCGNYTIELSRNGFVAGF